MNQVKDYVLVRTTDYLEADHILKPLCDIPFLTHLTDVQHSSIFQILRKDYNVYDDEDYKRLKEACLKYSPLSSQYRSTIHFCLNGLVTSHNMGSFEGRNFIIIDKLSNHIDEICNIRMEDTFVQGKFKISDDALILINESRYEELLQKYPYLNTYNVKLYSGNEYDAVNETLFDMDISPEKITAHGIEYDQDRINIHRKFLDSLNIPQEPHSSSKEYDEDDANNLKLWKIYNEYFYNKLSNAFSIDISIMLEDLPRGMKEDTFIDIINKIGLDNYKEFVQNYNEELVNYVNEGLFPTNREILEKGYISIKSKVL